MQNSLIYNMTALLGSVSYNDYSYNKIEIKYTNFSLLRAYGEAFFNE